jgi:lysine 2,3-aminomutase
MQKIICSTEEAEPPGTKLAAFPQKNAESTQQFKHHRLPSKKIPGMRSLPRVPVNLLLPENSRTINFRQRFFPEATASQWHNWRWQLRNRIATAAGLERIIRLSEDERQALVREGQSLPFAITPYYASLLEANDPHQPLRRTVVPVTGEYVHSAGESHDPLGEDSDSPVPGLVHRYPDRALFLVTEFCSTYCRYCTRSRMVGQAQKAAFHMQQWEQAIAYIEGNSAIRDVLLSGGDPLTLPDEKLEYLLMRLRQIPHVEILRIGTKVPMVLPQRITFALTRMLKRYHPLMISIHCTHPAELTSEVREACTRLADAGIPLGSQTVLLGGVNDRVDTMKELVHGLLRIRIRPYYLYQCDPIIGSGHFRTPVEKGLEVIQGLRGHTTGYAVPTYVIDAPGGGGKIPLLPEYVVGREGGDLLLKNYAGRIYRYPGAGGCEQAEAQSALTPMCDL